MGYTTDFDGSVEIDPPLNGYEVSFLEDLSETRRMDRANGPLYVRGSGFAGQGNDPDIYDYNSPPRDQPGLWCQWEPSDDGDSISWNGTEKFYYAAEWMKYIVQSLLAASARGYVDAHITEDPRLSNFTCDHVVNGTIRAQGEDPDDAWNLVVRDNEVFVQYGQITFSDERSV